MRLKLRIILITLLASCSSIRGCEEAQFTLAPDSRLPKWFSLPSGTSRSEVTVMLRYYVPTLSVDDAVLEMKRNGKELSSITGQRCWHPQMKNKRNQHGGFDPDSYPHYVYIRANGIIEVVEHARGPLFKVVDDPILVKQAVESNHCEKN
jgi:hypothetical protein